MEGARARESLRSQNFQTCAFASDSMALPPHGTPYLVPVLSNGLFGVCASTGLPLSCLIMVQDDFCQW